MGLSPPWLVQEDDVDEVAQGVASPFSKVEDGSQDEDAVFGKQEQVTGPPKVLPNRRARCKLLECFTYLGGGDGR